MIKIKKILLFLNGINCGFFVKKSYVENEGIKGMIFIYFETLSSGVQARSKTTLLELVNNRLGEIECLIIVFSSTSLLFYHRAPPPYFKNLFKYFEIFSP